MNNLLAKCVAELKKDKPELQYVIGILETLIEIQSPPKDAYLKATDNGVVVTTPEIEIKRALETSSDEASILEAQAKAMRGKLAQAVEE